MAVSSDTSSRRFQTAKLAMMILSCAIAMLMIPGNALATRLCLLPLSLPFEEGDERFEVVERKITAVFVDAGFEIAEPEGVLEVYESVNEQWGEIFDPLSGRVLAPMQERFTRELGGAYREKLGCDALLRVTLAVVRAMYTTPTAHWDGTKRQVVTTGRTILTVLAGQTEYGWVAALSLWVRLMDPEGENIGFRSAGIEPLVELSLSRDLDKLPIDRWLREEEFLDAAIESALGTSAQLLRTKGTSQGPIDEDALDWPGAS